MEFPDRLNHGSFQIREELVGHGGGQEPGFVLGWRQMKAASEHGMEKLGESLLIGTGSLIPV